VVAQEVKALAGQTAKATAEIGENVSVIQSSTRNSVEAVRETQRFEAPILVNVDSNQSPANYGDGNFGDGPYGGAITATTRYQESIHLNRPCQAIQFEFSDVESNDNYGPAFELSELLLIGGVLGPRFPVGAARSH
jgi:hypothetical protein